MKRILLVEDTADVREIVVEILKDAGYAVDEAGGFADAVSRLNEYDYDLVISNVLLPGGKNGLEISAIAEAKGINHLLITGHPDQMLALQKANRIHIPKPIRAADFVKEVRRACGDGSGDIEPGAVP